MDSTTTAIARIKKLTPRHEEIMTRLILGQKNKQIAEEMNLSESRLSIIINSPLFKLELRKKLIRRSEKLLDIEENLLDAATLGTKFHKDILEGVYPNELKQRSATVVSTLALKLIQPKNGGNGGEAPEEGRSYEERLREVTIRESVKTVKAEGDRPTPEDLEGEEVDEADLLFGSIENEEEPEPLPKIEEILAPKQDDKL